MKNTIFVSRYFDGLSFSSVNVCDLQTLKLNFKWNFLLTRESERINIKQKDKKLQL